MRQLALLRFGALALVSLLFPICLAAENLKLPSSSSTFDMQTAEEALDLCSKHFADKTYAVFRQYGLSVVAQRNYGKTSSDVDHTSAYTLGRGNVRVAGREREAFILAVRGTDAAEWYSNFDFAPSRSDSSFFAESFLFSAQDIFLNVYPIIQGAGSSRNPVILVCGHSRGAACANLLGLLFNAMTAKAPAAGRRILLERIGFIWMRLSFSVKVTARNLFRYKKRLYMTVFGIAGCSALLVAAFGLRDSIYDIVDKQFNEICKYDLMMMFEDSNVPACVRDVSSDYLPFRNEAGRVMNGTKVQPVFVYVPDNPDSLRQFVDLRHRKSHRPIALTDDGVVLSEKLCEQLGVHAGDSVTVENGDGLTGRAKVLGGAENYIYGLAFMEAKRP